MAIAGGGAGMDKLSFFSFRKWDLERGRRPDGGGGRMEERGGASYCGVPWNIAEGKGREW